MPPSLLAKPSLLYCPCLDALQQTTGTVSQAPAKPQKATPPAWSGSLISVPNWLQKVVHKRGVTGLWKDFKEPSH